LTLCNLSSQNREELARTLLKVSALRVCAVTKCARVRHHTGRRFHSGSTLQDIEIEDISRISMFR
jgi:hypothetical protein